MIDISQVYSFRKEYYGNVLSWFGTDTHDMYHRNLKYNFEEIKSLGYFNSDITYKINSCGFRCEEFKECDSVVFLGCSHTLGVGLHLEDTWSYIVSNQLNLVNYNLSITGGSNDSAFRVAQYYIPKIQPKIVIMLSPSNCRKEVINEHNQTHHYLISEDKINNNLLWAEWLSNSLNFSLNQQKNILAIEKICNDYSIKFYCFDSEKDFSYPDKARDLLHSGRLGNMKFSQKVLNTIG